MTTLYCLGDSLTYGLGVRPNQRWTHLVQAQGIETVNLGVNGDTAAGMLARIQKLELTAGRTAVLVMGGTNDIFCAGTDTGARACMAAILQQLLARGIQPVVGIPIPVVAEMAPEKWQQLVDFETAARVLEGYCRWLKVYCRTFDIPTVDFKKDYVNQDGSLCRDLYLDGLHPNAEGHRKMAARLLETKL